MRKISFSISCLACIFLLNNSAYSQGWVIEESINSITYISDGWIKSLPDEMDEVPMTSMYNPGSGIVLLINESDMTYAKGSADDYCNAMKTIMEEMNMQMPDEQKKMMDDMIAQEKAKPAPVVTVEKSSGGSVAGYNTTKYSIKVDGELFEEKWISDDASLNDLIRIMNETMDMTVAIAGCSVPDEVFLRNAPEFSETYKNIERAGIELKSVSYEYGSGESGTDVVSLQKEDLSSDEFEVPGDYSQISFGELIMSMSGM
jgi:hypothetical protein